MIELRFFVPGIPQTGGSKSAFPVRKGGVFTGKVAITEAGTAASRQRKKDWRATVAMAANKAVNESVWSNFFPSIVAVEVEFLFHLPRPKGHFRSNGVGLRPSAPRYHITKPDAGKLARGTQDALKGIIFHDDSQVVKEIHEKAFSDQPGCWIVVKIME